MHGNPMTDWGTVLSILLVLGIIVFMVLWYLKSNKKLDEDTLKEAGQKGLSYEAWHGLMLKRPRETAKG